MTCVTSLPPDPSPEEILEAGMRAAGGPVKLACSFSREDIVIIDIAQRSGLDLGIFAIDTGRLPEETYEVAESVIERYRRPIDWYFPRSEEVERLERQKGLFSFRESMENRRECCGIRKVEPLSRALAGLAGWVTGMRRTHGETRTEIESIEVDEVNGGILKINPLVFWSEEQVQEYALNGRLPINRLYARGYRSIGCSPCTRSVEEGEDERSGRWWWENPEQKECGLHRR